MKGTRHGPEQVVRLLRDADRLLGAGRDVAEVAKQLESARPPSTAGGTSTEA